MNEVSIGRQAYAATVAAFLGAFVALGLWDIHRSDWLSGHDAFANWEYARAAGHGRLPDVDETSVWHSPPLWFGLAGLAARIAGSIGVDQQLVGRLLALGAGVGLLVAVLALARAVLPDRRLLHLVALAAAAFAPPVVRAATMYHPETLCAALATTGLWCTARVLRGSARPMLLAGLGGVALGLASLTRLWGLPVAIAAVVCLALGGRARLGAAAVTGLVALALVTPWLVNQQRAHGSPLAFARDEPRGSLLDRRPAAFYLGPRLLESISRPFAPHARNELVPQVYADWWGDFALTWRAGAVAPPGSEVAPRPGERRQRVLQSLLGVVPSLLSFAGIVALGLLARRRRDTALALVPVAALALVASYVLFQIRFPSPDGDTLKATYLLCGIPAYAIGLGFAVDVLAARSRGTRVALAIAGAATLATMLPFLVL